MKIIVYLLGIGYIVLSSFLILYTKEAMDALKGVTRNYKLKHLALFPLVGGLLFIISASATCYPWVFMIFGLVGFCKAALAFTDPQRIYTRFMDWYFEKVSVRTNQFVGIIGVIFGTLILTWAL